jgi:hypothetical protein
MTASDDGATWLPAWMGRQLDLGVVQRAVLPSVSGDAIYLCGSIGVDTALTAAGAIYVGEYDVDETLADGSAPSIRWRQVEGLEQIGWIVLGARRFAELGALLPARSSDATACAACRGTGDWHVFSGDRKESLRIRGMICKDCGGLGWRAPESATSVLH